MTPFNRSVIRRQFDFTADLPTHRLAPSRRVPAQLGLSANIGGMTIDVGSGGWSVTDPALGTTIGSGTTPTIYSCPDPVPIQNAITTKVLSPVSDAVSYNTQNLTYNDLQMLWNALVGTENSWLTFLHNPRCTDSRWRQRSAGAEATLAPYFQGLKSKIQSLILTASPGGGTTVPPVVPVQSPGTPPITVPITPTGTVLAGLSSPTALLLGGLALWYFMGRRR